MAPGRSWKIQSAGYGLIGVIERLPLPAGELERIGQRKCKELSKLALAAPKKLKPVLDKVRKNPEMPMVEVRQLVDQSLSGQHMDSGKYVNFDFSVKVEDADTVRNALEVIQEMSPLGNTDTRTARGLQLVSLLTDWLGYPEQVAVLKKLRDAGKLGMTDEEFEKE